MKLLVTGSKGFIGTYYCQNSQYREYITPFSFQYDNIDSTDFSSFDTIVHLAALVHQMNGAKASEYQKINADKTVLLAKKAKSEGVKQFVFMSTVKVYGDKINTIYTEESSCDPQDDYGKSKFTAEQELLKLQNDHFTISIIRTPIVYGAGVKANIKNLIRLIQILPILPFGRIQNRRSMVYIGNLCSLIDTVIAQKAEGIYLASDDFPLSTTEFIDKTARALGKKRHLVSIPFFGWFLRCIQPSLYQRLYANLEVNHSQTKQKLNFKNPYSTDEGIRLMIQGM